MLLAYRAMLALIPLAAIPLVEVSGQVTVEYDEIRDFTSATSDTIELMHPGGKVGTGVQLQAMFVCHGDTLCQPGRVTLQFQVQSYYGWRFLRYHDLVLLADTVRINLGELESHYGEPLSLRRSCCPPCRATLFSRFIRDLRGR